MDPNNCDIDAFTRIAGGLVLFSTDDQAECSMDPGDIWVSDLSGMPATLWADDVTQMRIASSETDPVDIDALSVITVDDVRILGLVPAPCNGTPGEVQDVAFSADRETLVWDRSAYASGQEPVYDVLRSGAADDFDTGMTCIESDDGTDTTARDPDLPVPGAVFYYLVRPENDCGAGSLGGNRSGGPC